MGMEEVVSWESRLCRLAPFSFPGIPKALWRSLGVSSGTPPQAHVSSSSSSLSPPMVHMICYDLNRESVSKCTFVGWLVGPCDLIVS